MITDPGVKAIAECVSKALGIPLAQLEQEIERRVAERCGLLAQRERRWQRMLAMLTAAQELRLLERERQGYRLVKLYQSRASSQVAAVMQKDHAWNSKRGKVSRKLAVLYPDGGVSETFERTISIRNDF